MAEITQCRICGSKDLVDVVNLGELCFTGIFPRSKDEFVPKGRLQLVKCLDDTGCGLLQLKDSFDLNILYGKHYGYRSGLNPTMVKHLAELAAISKKFVNLKKDDVILDIGSNDGTFLRNFPENMFMLVGIDPTGEKFKDFYREDILLLPNFFSKELIKGKLNNKPKLITSIAMFYDLEAPLDFMRDIFEILDDDGVWLFEQSYTPKMIQDGAYDTICHEHLDYYCLKQIKWMADVVGFKIREIIFNEVNGGSFCIVVSKKGKESDKVEKFLEFERKNGFNSVKRYEQFEEMLKKHKTQLRSLLYKIKDEKKKVFGYGASTKGNVVLQYCEIDRELVPLIAEINEDKYNCFTPGTYIPIISEKEAMSMKPDYLLVLPWHFKDFIIKKEIEYLKKGGQLLFPLPQIEVFKL